MIGLWLAATVLSQSPPSVVDAERAYAALAQSRGQWTAFRATAADDAIMFVPEPVKASNWLQGRADPSVSVKWQPAEAYVSCDGQVAATTGPWQGPQRSGYFATIWSRLDAGWRWNVDFGEALEKPMPPAPADVQVRRAACNGTATADLPRISEAKQAGHGASPDHTLEWRWSLQENGARRFIVYLWNGHSYDAVIDRAAGS